MLAAGLWGSTVFLAQAQEKKVKDQAEYDLFTAAAKETDLNKKVQLLAQWKEKYPTSDYREDRQLMMITAFQQLRQGDKMWEATNDLLAMNPKSLAGLFFMVTLTTSLNNTSPERLDAGEKAGRGLLANLDEFYDPAKRPPQTTEENFKKERLTMETTARRTLGWVEMARKNNEKAEAEFTELLKVNPNSGQVSYWLGSVMLAQKKPEKQIPALWHFARAAHYQGEDALTPEGKKQLQSFLERNYTNFHGSKEGLQELVDGALKSPFPPPDFKIKSAVEIAIEEEEELKKTDPQKAIWVGVKKELLGPGGSGYFENQLKDSALPKLKGKVVSVTPAARPKEVLVSVATDDGTPEIKLVLDTPFPNPANPGDTIEFTDGVAKAFSNDPFLLTLEQERAKVTGWPAPARPAPKAATKKAVGKKK